MALEGQTGQSNPKEGDPWEGDLYEDIPPPIFTTRKKYLFKPFYYPYSDLLIQQFNRYGIKGILKPDGNSEADLALTLQRGLEGDFEFDFEDEYGPHQKTILRPYPKETFDFTFGGAYSDYNWELFFHNPILAATRLSQNQKFEEAQKWFHYIFDPTISFNPNEVEGTPEEIEQKKKSRFWRIKPFYEFSEEPNIERFLASLSLDPENPAVVNLENQIGVWRENPFMPHLLAQMRVVSYMKYTVMKYLDNLIDWGDSLFRQDTMESLNEATQIYLLASTILGARPQKVTRNDREPKSYEDLFETPGGFDSMSNALIELENGITGSPVRRGSSNVADDNGLASINVLFFCIPSNEKLEEYWDTVADRLFKIRNCQSIDGVERQLALFAPPIDPMALVKAVGSGGGFLEAIQNLNSPIAPYRFSYMLQRALELAGDVKSLGGALLSALEKKDAEVIAGIRNQHEVKVLDNLRHAKRQAVEEANLSIEALVQSKDAIQYRYSYYSSRAYMSAEEKQQLDNLKTAMDMEIGVAKAEMLVGTLSAIPPISFGVNGALGTPHFATKIDGRTLSAIASASLRMIHALAQKERNKANRASIKAGYDRRQDDWRFQAESAKIELKQVDKQIEGAYHRREIALYELDLNEKQLKNAEEIGQVMETKYTNKELYSWMISEISRLYFRSYKLAYDFAKIAERCFQFERPEYAGSYIDNTSWNSLKKGLLAGDYLSDNLRRMQTAYDKNNHRRLEINKNVSLVMLNPDSLIELRRTGKCTINIPEVLFDLDFPGHYRRRIKTVAISIPCVVGPNGNVSAKLTLLNNFVRNDIQSVTYTTVEENYTVGRNGVQAIATSTANRDSGMFEMNFNDQRYLPFEGAGVISEWNLELPDPKFSQFDYNTISDVILHISYEAEEGGNSSAVETYLNSNIDQIVVDWGNSENWTNLISLKEQFSSKLFSLFNGDKIDLALLNQYFPYFFRNKALDVLAIDVIVLAKDGAESLAAAAGVSGLKLAFTDGGTNPQIDLTFTHNMEQNSLKGTIGGESLDLDVLNMSIEKIGDADPELVVMENILDIVLIVHFQIDLS